MPDQGGAYQFTNDGTCRGCGARLSWFTTPAGKKIPVNSSDLVEKLREIGIPSKLLERGYTVDRKAARELLLPLNHFATCPPERRRT